MELRLIEQELKWRDFLVVRLLRRWVAARADEEQPLPALVALAATLGEAPAVAISLHSVFELTESCLERPLEAECCCSPAIGRDEQAILKLLAAAPVTGMPFTSGAIPHGLPGALSWAVATANLAMRLSARQDDDAAGAECPFGRDDSGLDFARASVPLSKPH
jgi:hypothetical protein